ncbi:chromate efflux transporter [Reinekea blandensis]|uniref:Probable chromate ion transporter n=1 Tax=Reinekea blandensis MED297 TaxID=314283 RepID=A4BCW7_9GAMM|nr:chromate efflux transporter [Reinekea blandensis]EAR10049.1 probable chromate ion transporter [Reinekea sp. MED297] [Reinekea blandensis MED297]
MPSTTQPQKPRVLEVFLVFLRLGLTAFGGPIAHLGYFRRELVDKRQWLSEAQYSQLVALCQFLPGPASSQVGFGLGWLRAGWAGALAAFVAFTLPSVLLLIAFYYALPGLPAELADTVIHGLKLVACVVVTDAVLSMHRNLCPDRERQLLAIAVAALLLLTHSPWWQLIAIVGGAVFGRFLLNIPIETATPNFLIKPKPILSGIFTALFALMLLLLPLISDLNPLIAATQSFYQAGALVFGGGHVVLPLLESSVVATGHVSADTFLAGYGAAQAVPGPLFTFAAFLGADMGGGATITVAVLAIFLPGFLLLAAVLPYWQRVSAMSGARDALAGIGAAVVGILGAALYDPIFTSAAAEPEDLAVVLIGLSILRVARWSPLWVVVFCVGAGFVV